MTAAKRLDAATEAEAAAELRRCCGAERWVTGMLARRPFGDDGGLHAAADDVWDAMSDDDVREALSHHPEIGVDLDALRSRFGSTATWAAGEQAGVVAADEATLVALRDGNVRYREKFGYIFVVCATGKTAAQMLALLQSRLDNDAQEELPIAAAEQAKITRLRLEKL